MVYKTAEDLLLALAEAIAAHGSELVSMQLAEPVQFVVEHEYTGPDFDRCWSATPIEGFTPTSPPGRIRFIKEK